MFFLSWITKILEWFQYFRSALILRFSMLSIKGTYSMYFRIFRLLITFAKTCWNDLLFLIQLWQFHLSQSNVHCLVLFLLKKIIMSYIFHLIFRNIVIFNLFVLYIRFCFLSPCSSSRKILDKWKFLIYFFVKNGISLPWAYLLLRGEFLFKMLILNAQGLCHPL